MGAFVQTWKSNDTRYRSEYDAHFAEAGVYQALSPGEVTTYGAYEIPVRPGMARNLLENLDLWNPSWKLWTKRRSRVSKVLPLELY